MSDTTNPARELHTLLSGWADRTGRNVALYESRPFGDDGSPVNQAQNGTIRACMLLSQIERRIDNLSEGGLEVSAFLSQLETWKRMALPTSIPWSSGSERDALYPVANLNSLSIFATFLDISTLGFDDVPPIVRLHVHEYIEAVAAALDEDVDLPDDYRAYLSWIIDSVRESIGSGDATHLYRLLQTAHHGLFRAAAESKNPGLWTGLIAKWSGDVMKSTAASVAAKTVQSALGM